MKSLSYLEPRVEYLNDDRILAAKLTVDLRVEEIKRAREVLKEAEKQLDFIANKCFKEKGLKALEGEIIYLKDYELLYAAGQDQLFRITPFGGNQ